MAGYGDRPFGLREIVLYHEGGTLPVILPASMMFHFTPLFDNYIALVEGSFVGSNTRIVGLEWEIEHGGLSLEVLAKLTGDTEVLTGSTPNRVLTLAQSAGDVFPYIRIYGRSLSEIGQARIRIYRAKLNIIEGTFRNKEFWITFAKGIAVQGANPLYDVAQQETAAAL